MRCWLTYHDGQGVDGGGADREAQQRHGELHADVADGQRDAACEREAHQGAVGLPDLVREVGAPLLRAADLRIAARC